MIVVGEPLQASRGPVVHPRARAVAGPVVIAWIRRVLGVGSPSQHAAAAGAASMDGLASGVASANAWAADFRRVNGRAPTQDERITRALAIVDAHPETLAHARRVRDLHFPDGE